MVNALENNNQSCKINIIYGETVFYQEFAQCQMYSHLIFNGITAAAILPFFYARLPVRHIRSLAC